MSAARESEAESVKPPAALILGLAGWLPLAASLLAALGDASDAAIAVPLIAAGIVAIFGVVLAVRAIASEASSLTAVTSGLALVLNVALLVAATLWAASVHWQ